MAPAMIFISHDIVMAARLANVIAVMERGRIVEIGDTRQITDSPGRVATRSLLECVPGLASKTCLSSIP